MSPEITIQKRDGSKRSFQVNGKVGLLTEGDKDVLQVRKKSLKELLG